MEIKIDNVMNDIKTYPDCYFNTIFSDPPYQLGSEWMIDETGNPQLKVKQDFMLKWDAIGGHEWDVFFENAFRILKYGGYCILFCIERQGWVLSYYATKHGFQVCQSLFWYFLEGFPKGVDVARTLDGRAGKVGEVIGFGDGKRTDSGSGIYSMNNGKCTMKPIYEIRKPATRLASLYNGYKYGVAPFKPTVETILVFRKPPLKSVIEDIESENPILNLLTSPSVVNIKDTLVPLASGEDLSVERSGEEKMDTTEMGWGFKKTSRGNWGRYIGQLFLTFETASLIDKQTGKLTGCNWKEGTEYKSTDNQNCYGRLSGKLRPQIPKDSGGGSKISHICDYEKEEIELVKYCPKVVGSERNAGLSGEKNRHPTLKPVRLTTWIATLFKLPEECCQKWYVPFAGTLSEVIGIIRAGCREDSITVCELDEKFIDIGLKRLEKLTGVKIDRR